MAFALRHYRRFPVTCPVAYHIGLWKGHGTLLNVSHSGFRFSGHLPLRAGQTCALIMSLPQAPGVFVPAGIVKVRWVRANEYGVETLVGEKTAEDWLAQYIRSQAQQNLEP